MTWEYIWDPCLDGISQDELRKLIYDFSPSPHGMKVKDMNQQDIGLGDIVSLGWSDGYDTASVVQVHKDGTVDLFRPYTHTADFSCAGRNEGSLSVIPYVGYEEIKSVNPERLKVVRKNKIPVR